MFKFIIILFIVVLLTIGVVYFVFHHRIFQVVAVDVSGSDRADEIKDILIDTLSKSSKIRTLLGPENMLFWSPKISQIPSSLFWLSDLSLRRNWSQKEISIEGKERQPWLLWCLSIQTGLFPNQTINDIGSLTVNQMASTTINNCYWLDNHGIVFSSAPEAEGSIIPKVFEKSDRQELIFGQLFNTGPQLAKNALEIIRETKNSSLIIRRFLIENINLQELTAETKGPKLYFSLRFVPQDLNEILSNLSDRLDFSKLEYIDFRVENRIYYK